MVDPNSPTFICDDYDLHWQMTRWEKIFLSSFLNKVKPEYAIEVGTYLGGSLQVLADFCEQVVSIEISENARERLQSRFDNVEFLVGDSKQLLPDRVANISCSPGGRAFVLIDGDHSRAGVRADIENVLTNYNATCELFVVCHDSFNPDCRAGMRDVDYLACDHLHYAELDFIPGVYHFEPFDTAEERSMWGGLALLHLKPEKRTDELVVLESQKGSFDAVYRDSIYSDS